MFHYLFGKRYTRFPVADPKFPQTGGIILSKLMSRLCSMKKIPNLLLTNYFMLLLKYLLNGYDAISPSLCKSLLKPKIGYDLKITCTILGINEILSDQDPMTKSRAVTLLFLGMDYIFFWALAITTLFM